MSAERYKRNTALWTIVPLVLLVAAYTGWALVQSNRPEPYETYDRDFPALTSPAAAPFDDPSLAYTFTIPAGLVAMPDTGGADVLLAPAEWFPTDASVTVTAKTLKTSADELSEKELIAAAREADYGPGVEDEVTVGEAADGSRVLFWAGCCSTPSPLNALVYRGKRVALVATDTPDDGDDTEGALDAAARELVASFTWR
ncbi:hypothetical protein [Phytomonospora endophytica]|uniref:Uncharacterized protein n=1 Tax=Phytomonospora endophytica TaxID=714109 RepID=A0A841FW19_9ACTN|nr:hypothetical protein [Phytomonospora endophytica]MBB6036679.1 hypothetical protein [Phytomonospora endophytica]GIG66001.1 hypothetical protein Pen01_22960 [Phytomonospora endophytica]